MKARSFDGLVIAVAAGIVYVATAPRWILGGDNAELVTIFARGGVAHPPGYPLYEMMLRAFAWLPLDAPFASAVVTALIGVASIVVLHAAATAWGASRPAAAIATAIYAGSRLAWTLSSSAEVFTLNVLVAATLVLVAAPDAPVRGWKRALGVSLAFGLGLSNHHSIVLLAPIALYALVCALREDRSWRAIAAAASGLAVGLSPYAYLFWEATHSDPARAWVWGNIHDAASLFRHFRRAEYGTTRLALRDAPLEPGFQIRTFAVRSVVELLALPVLVVIAGVLSMRRAKAGVVALVASALLAGPVFVAIFNIAPRGLSALIVERFYLLPCALLAILGALAIDRLVPRVRDHVRIGWAIAAVALLAQLAIAAPTVAEAHRPTVDQYIKNTLEIAPLHAIVIGSGDEKVGGWMYAQKVLGLRPDIDFVSPNMLYAPWELERTSAALGVSLSPPTSDRLTLVEELEATGRPIAFTGPVPPIIYASHMETYPHGTLQILARKSDPRLDIDTVERNNLVVLSRYVLEPASSTDRDTWSGATFAEYARSWVVLEAAFRAQGKDARADDCHKRAVAFAPWLH